MMRPTDLRFRSPKQRTGEMLYPPTTCEGRPISFSTNRTRHFDQVTFPKSQRFHEYKILEKRTGGSVGPGTYNNDNGSIQKKPRKGVKYVIEYARKNGDAAQYQYIGHTLMQDESTLSKKGDFSPFTSCEKFMKHSMKSFDMSRNRSRCTTPFGGQMHTADGNMFKTTNNVSRNTEDLHRRFMTNFESDFYSKDQVSPTAAARTQGKGQRTRSVSPIDMKKLHDQKVQAIRNLGRELSRTSNKPANVGSGLPEQEPFYRLLEKIKQRATGPVPKRKRSNSKSKKQKQESNLKLQTSNYLAQWVNESEQQFIEALTPQQQLSGFLPTNDISHISYQEESSKSPSHGNQSIPLRKASNSLKYEKAQ